MLPPNDPAAAQVRSQLSLAAREALADTHARERRARRWIFFKRATCWLAILGGLVAGALGLVDVFHDRGGVPQALAGFFVAAVAAAILVAPLLTRAWARREKRHSIEHAFDDSTD